MPGVVNPLVAQGSLNRVVASITIPSFPILNVTASYLGREGIRLALEGEANRRLPTMTGVVNSPEVFQDARVTVNLLKTQPLSDLFKTQMETDVRIGDITVRPDVPVGSGGLSPYAFSNCTIQSLRELNFAGEDAGWVIELRGIYYINADLFAGV